MEPIKVVLHPFHKIGGDLIGPLKTIRQGNKYILTVIDFYIKYDGAQALPKQEAETVVRRLEQILQDMECNQFYSPIKQEMLYHICLPVRTDCLALRNDVLRHTTSRRTGKGGKGGCCPQFWKRWPSKFAQIR